MRTAAAWAAGERRGCLDPDLLVRLAETGHQIAAPVPGEDTADAPLLARAFHQLPERLQIVLWHRTVEGEDPARIARCVGAGPDSLPSWPTTADRFRTSYGRLYEEAAAPQCRPFSRLVIATAGTGLARTVATKGADGLGGHLAACRECGRAFRELALLHRPEEEWGPLLADSLLPWGGRRYCAARAVARAGKRPPAVQPPAPAPPPTPLLLRAVRTSSGRFLLASAVAGVALCVVLLRPQAPAPPPAASATTPSGSYGGVDRWSGRPTPHEGGDQKSPKPSRSASPKPATSPSPKPRADPPPPSKKPPAAEPGPLTGSRLRWDFEQPGARPVDTSAAGLPGSYQGRVEWSDQRRGSVWLNGESYVETQSAVVDTSRSFTVSAWARLTSDAEFYTVAAQDGNNISGFFLQYAEDDDRWRLAMGHADSPEAEEDEAESSAPPARDTWQHLTGVFDAGSRQLRLYVDGRLQDTAAHSSTWNANGSFTIGRGLWEGDQADRFRGYVDDVRAYRRAMSPSEIAALAAAGPNA
ncbi:LamG domain-containing protein [Streptomyces sp. NPDC088729]|uniref:LamG domain-containing protein n=1 Tax=Streptomyces sp. NPDC088729 TaxID=3365876 RepID=UPI0037F95348